MDEEWKADDCGANGKVGREQGLEGPTQFPGWPDIFHFTSTVHSSSSNSVLKFQVAKTEDSRQPELIEFKI